MRRIADAGSGETDEDDMPGVPTTEYCRFKAAFYYCTKICKSYCNLCDTDR